MGQMHVHDKLWLCISIVLVLIHKKYYIHIIKDSTVLVRCIQSKIKELYIFSIAISIIILFMAVHPEAAL